MRTSSILLLAVKPRHYRDVVSEFANLVREAHLLVSIMAGPFEHIVAGVVVALDRSRQLGSEQAEGWSRRFLLTEPCAKTAGWRILLKILPRG